MNHFSSNGSNRASWTVLSRVRISKVAGTKTTSEMKPLMIKAQRSEMCSIANRVVIAAVIA